MGTESPTPAPPHILKSLLQSTRPKRPAANSIHITYSSSMCLRDVLNLELMPHALLSLQRPEESRDYRSMLIRHKTLESQ